MPPPLAAQKIRADHLDRLALIYVRQSTPIQVRENTASTARQYDLAAPGARDLGWPEHIQVIDQDQGRSGASAAGRDGFQHLIAQVGLGQAGAVLSLEASRLARSCSDWYRLIEICALTDTLVIDEDGVYDPTQYTDRLLLGFLGTMSEAELHWLRSRLLGGKLEKARRRPDSAFRPPTGLVYDPAGRIVLDPDEQVQQAIRLVFDLFEQSGSALAVVQHFADHHLRCPTRLWGGCRDGQLVWGPLSHGRVLAILHNPAYAGAYVYGRTKTRGVCLPGEEPEGQGADAARSGPRTGRSSSPATTPGTSPGSSSSGTSSDSTRTARSATRTAAVPCARASPCSRGSSGAGGAGGGCPSATSRTARSPHMSAISSTPSIAGPTCQSIRGDAIDAAVARVFLEAMRPAQLEVSMAALDRIAAQARQLDRQWQLTLERARYEAELARRRFLAVDPENRLVGRTLEREWNEKLAEVERLERERPCSPPLSTRLVGPEERRRILALARDLPAIWQAPTTRQADRKQLLGYLIKDVTIYRRETTIARGHPLADRGVHRAGGPSAPAHVRPATDRPGGRRAGPALAATRPTGRSSLS